MSIKKSGRYYVVKFRGFNVTFFGVDRLEVMVYSVRWFYGQ